MNEYHDYLVRAIAAKDQIRAFACTTKELVEYARNIRNSSPLSTAALGRLLSAGCMMGDMMKSESDKLTLEIHGDGPLRQILVTANIKGEVRGYVSNNSVDLPPNEGGHLNVGAGIGKGTLTVIRDLGMKEPYVSQIALHSGEIADDLTYYFAQSEQTPTSVGLGVLFDHDDSAVKAAGGFIVQLMPNAQKEVVDHLEDNINRFSTVTDVLREGKTPEELLAILLDGFDLHFTEHKPLFFRCNCSQSRGEEVLRTLGKEGLEELIREGKEIEVTCDFCDKRYRYSLEDLKRIRLSLNQEEKSE